MTEALVTLRRWKRAEYDRLIDLGVFEGDNIELIGGQLVVAELKGAYHCSAVSTADYALRAVLPPGWIVRTQAAVSLDDESEPEPDLVVVPGRPGDYRHAHPACPPLVIEVSDSRLAFDRVHKGSLFARAVGTIGPSPRSRRSTSCPPSPSRPSGSSSPTCCRSRRRPRMV
jgi:Uma2 family endonuclease